MKTTLQAIRKINRELIILKKQPRRYNQDGIPYLIPKVRWLEKQRNRLLDLLAIEYSLATPTEINNHNSIFSNINWDNVVEVKDKNNFVE
jgi:hypothetical protein